MEATAQKATEVFREARRMLSRVDPRAGVGDYLVALNAVQDKVNEAVAILAQAPVIPDEQGEELLAQVTRFEYDRDELELRRMANGFVE